MPLGCKQNQTRKFLKKCLISTLLSIEKMYVWVQINLCVMYKLPMQQYSQKVLIFLTKMPFLFLQVNFYTSTGFCRWRTLNCKIVADKKNRFSNNNNYSLSARTCKTWFSYCASQELRYDDFSRGIKHDFPFINICIVPREVF